MPPRALPAVFLLALLVLSAADLALAVPRQPGAGGQSVDGGVASQSSRQWWAGTLELPGPQGPVLIATVFSLAPDPTRGEGRNDGDGWAGSFDLAPGAGTAGISAMELGQVTVTPTELTFAVPPPIVATFRLTRTSPVATTATGEAHIDGLPALPVSLRLVTEAEARSRIIPRPQTPLAPFPYAREEVSIASPADGLMLAGTLTLPAGPGPHAAAVLVSDAGEQDRDHTDAFHRPFLVLADHLARRGIAVLRLDDRGVGGSAGVLSEATIDTLAGDLRGALAALAQRSDIDPARIGVISLGDGSLAATMAATEGPGIAWLVLLSPPGLPGRDMALLREQRRMEAEGEDQAFIDAQIARSKRVIDLVVDNADQPAVAAAIREVVVGSTTALRGEGITPEDWQIDEAVGQQAFAYTSPSNRRWLTLDPADSLRRLSVPVLAIAGGLDLVAPHADSFPKVEDALVASKAEMTTKLFPMLNHNLQPATTGFTDETAGIQTTIHPDVIALVGGWIAARTASKP